MRVRGDGGEAPLQEDTAGATHVHADDGTVQTLEIKEILTCLDISYYMLFAIQKNNHI